MAAVRMSEGVAGVARQEFLLAFGESPSGKAPDFDSGIRRFDPYLPSQIFAGLKSRLQRPVLRHL
jgi:hypothetical protein